MSVFIVAFPFDSPTTKLESFKASISFFISSFLLSEIVFKFFRNVSKLLAEEIMGLVIKSGVFSFIIFVISKTDTPAVFVFMSVDLEVIFWKQCENFFLFHFRLNKLLHTSLLKSRI